ncbi:MAG: DUF6153 family protein [Rhodococcus sp. (in: high G+C Gram-positive bacteria)]
MANQRGNGSSGPSRVLLIALTVLGVLFMHSWTPASPAPRVHEGMSMVSDRADLQGAIAEHDCPSGHHAMHACMGTVTKLAPIGLHDIDVSVAASSNDGGRSTVGIESRFGRAPPWALWELDRSVMLRV